MGDDPLDEFGYPLGALESLFLKRTRGYDPAQFWDRRDRWRQVFERERRAPARDSEADQILVGDREFDR